MIMDLTFAPVRSDDALTLERRGAILVVNGQALDFADLAEGEPPAPEAPGSPFLVAPPRLEGGVLFLHLLLPHGPDAPDETRFPAPVTVLQDGPVMLPGQSGTQAGA